MHNDQFINNYMHTVKKYVIGFQHTICDILHEKDIPLSIGDILYNLQPLGFCSSRANVARAISELEHKKIVICTGKDGARNLYTINKSSIAKKR